MLHDIAEQLSISDRSSRDDLSFWAACLTTLFFSFLRKAHVAVKGEPNQQTVMLEDLQLRHGALILSIHHTKTIQHGERVIKHRIPEFAAADSIICPHHNIMRYHGATHHLRQRNSAFFLQDFDAPTGPKPLTYNRFLKKLKECLAGAGHDPAAFAGEERSRTPLDDLNGGRPVFGRAEGTSAPPAPRRRRAASEVAQPAGNTSLVAPPPPSPHQQNHHR